MLAGRPGSWEAGAVRSMLVSTVGYDDEDLDQHRTEPPAKTRTGDDAFGRDSDRPRP